MQPDICRYISRSGAPQAELIFQHILQFTETNQALHLMPGTSNRVAPHLLKKLKVARGDDIFKLSLALVA